MRRKKLFFFGIDSATWDLIIPWAKQGKLPGFAKLLKQGSTFDLISTMPPITPVAWPSMLTGVSPAQHGIYDFYKLDKNKELTVNLADEIKYPFVWELLSQQGKKVAVFNIPLTYPVRPVNGVLISGLLTPGLKSEFIYPPSLKKEFCQKFPKYLFSPKSKVTKHDVDSYDIRFKEMLQEASDVIKVSEWLLKKDAWDFVAINFMAVDHVQHFYWEFLNKKDSKYRLAILKIYQKVDAYLVKIIEKYASKYQLVVASDHGAGPLEKTLFLNLWLMQKGYLRFKRNPATYIKRLLTFLGVTPEELISIASKIKLSRRAGKYNMQKRNRFINKLVLSYQDVDFDKSQAYAFGMYSGIFINKKFKTKVLINKIMRELKKDFGQYLTFIDTSANIYNSKNYPQTIPDIQFLMRDGAIVSTNIYAFSGHKLFTPPITHKSGEHRLKGILGFYPKVNTLNRSRQVNILDITPSILDFFAVDKPKYCQGSSLFEKRQPENLTETQKIKV